MKDKNSYYRHPCSHSTKPMNKQSTLYYSRKEIQYRHVCIQLNNIVDSATVPYCLIHNCYHYFMHVPFALFIVGSHDKQQWGKEENALSLSPQSYDHTVLL